MKIDMHVKQPKQTHHFWYSQKYEEMTSHSYYDGHKKSDKIFALIGGKKVYYSFCASEKENHGYGWDDMVYLGAGTFIYE